MSKRCELQKEYYQQYGNYKGNGKYSDEYVSWLEEQILALRIHDVVGRSERAWVVYNINGDVIGVADSYGKALSIYEERYGDTPEHPEESINMFEVNRLHYA